VNRNFFFFCLLGSLIKPEDRGKRFIRYVSKLIPDSPNHVTEKSEVTGKVAPVHHAINMREGMEV
jgi:hypothetical protein